MKKEDLVSLNDFCRIYNAEPTFISSLQEYELIEIITIDKEPFIDPDQIARAEKLIRLHEDLKVNPEGIDAIFHLLQRMESLQRELMQLKNRLSRFE